VAISHVARARVPLRQYPIGVRRVLQDLVEVDDRVEGAARAHPRVDFAAFFAAFGAMSVLIELTRAYRDRCRRAKLDTT
jgi:hypothetical protein